MMETRIRKLKNNLAVSGLGTIVFGIWSIVKTTMYILLDSKTFLGSAADKSTFVKGVLYFLLYLLMLIDLLFRYKAGRAAIRIGRDEIEKSARPVVDGSIVLIFSMITVVYSLIPGMSETDSYAKAVITAIIDMSSLFAVAEMIYSALMIKHLRKLQKEGGGCSL